MKKLLILLVVLSLTASVSAQEPTQDGITEADLGILMQEGYRSELAYAVGVGANVGGLPFVGGIINRMEFSLLVSDKAWMNAAETRGLMVMAMKEVDLNGRLRFGLGAGSWALIDSEGADQTFVAYRVKVSYKPFDMLRVSAVGDVVDVRDGADMYFPRLKVNMAF